MEFFIDFEATQYSDRIINIGCIASNGATFSTLVKPARRKDKVTKFITELTGITNEMLATAPSADEAFNAFFDFVLENSPKEPNQFYCYGNCDTTFIERTMHDMTDTRATTFAKRLQHSLIDYATFVKNYFRMDNDIALKKVYALILEDEVEQHHNALEDAQMLFTVAKNLQTKCVPEDKKKIAAMPKTVKPIPNAKNRLKKAPEKFVNWPADKWDADTGADETNWVVCGGINNRVKYFDSMDTAVLWVMRYLSKGMSPKNLTHYDIVRSKLEKGIETGSLPYSFAWYKKDDGLVEIL
jgi:DNA polymerase III epsilon subunit-like protein